ncbi:hypothetical protein AB0I81_44940 [Nonomuraea sp. NPDC050404]|uniref:hypothetical protein n=1 Tax=Nonomuraea sp. NPDC050404 TaxID=3155783 RepID=UPI0033CE5250
MNAKLIVRISLGLLAPLAALLVAGGPARAATAQGPPVCAPETPVCTGLDNGSFVFTIQPPPATLTWSATVNGVPVGGNLTYRTEPGYIEGSFEPSAPLVSGDVICMTFHGPEVPPGPYCRTSP